MATRNVAVRLAVIDGQRVKAELTEVGEAGHKALVQIERGAGPASAGLERVARSAEAAGRTAPMLGDLSHMMSGFVGGLAAGAASAGLAWLTQLPQAFSAINRAAREAEESQHRVETALLVTGNSAGLTAQQLLEFSDQQEAATLDSAEAIQNASAVLLTFKSVSGETFTRAISLAQDMATVFGGDLNTNITRLGKALEEPIEGLNALRRVGVSFTDEQKEMIKTLVETGRQLEAQQAILSAIEGQGVLGQAAAQAQGVTGASNALADAWGNMLEALGQTPWFKTIVQRELDGLKGDVQSFTDFVTGEASNVENRLKSARATLAERQANPVLSTLFPGSISAAERNVAGLEQAAQQNASIAAMMEGADKRFAQEAEARHQTEMKINAVVAERVKLEEQAGKLRQRDVGERTAQVQAELDATRTRLESQRTPETGGEVDRAIANAEEIARRKNALIEEEVARTRDAEARKGESAARAAEREAEAKTRAAEQKLKDDERYRAAEIEAEGRQLSAVQTLEDAYAQLTGTQIGNIDLVLKRQLEANAREIENIGLREQADIAATQRAEAEKAKLRETALLSARKEVLNAQVGAAESRARDPAQDEERRTAAAQEGMELRIQMERDETEQRLISLQQLGLSETDYAITREALVMSSEARIQEIIAKTSRQREEDGLTAEKIATQFSRTISSGLTELVMQGMEGFDSLTDAFQSFLDGMQRQLIQTGIEAAIGTTGKGGVGGSGILGMIFSTATTAGMSYATGGASGGMGTGGAGNAAGGGSTISGWNATWAHAGSPGVSIRAPAELWHGAPRYHSGYAPPSLAPWERAAIITKDETVSTPAQMRNMRSPINVTINNNSSEPVSTKDDGRGGVQIDIGNVVASTLSKPGSPAHQAIRGMIQSEMRSGG